MKKYLKGLAILIMLGVALTANAIEGQWTAKYYYANTGKPFAGTYTDGNCFLADGTWYSTTLTGVHGHWYQKGDQLYINAVSPDKTEVYSAQLESLYSNQWTGKHQHWSVDGSSTVLLYLKESLTFKSATCAPPAP